MEFNIFATPFNVEATDVPHLLQLEIIQLQNNSELKARYNNIPLLEFNKSYIRDDEFRTLKKHALKYASVFGTTYLLLRTVHFKTHSCKKSAMFQTY